MVISYLLNCCDKANYLKAIAFNLNISLTKGLLFSLNRKTTAPHIIIKKGNIMTSQAMEKFREKYRAAISPSYSGWLHMLFVLVIGVSVISYGLMQISDAN